MLQAIREKVTGWIAYGIIFLISIPFALWGVNSYFGGGEIQPAAIVNGEEISSRELDQAYANYRQRLSRMFGGTIPETFGNEETLRAQVLDQLIEEIALRQYVLDQRYRIGDAELNQIIREMEVFQSDGQFDSAIYEAQLRSLGYSPLGFEQELRASGAMEQLQNGIRATAFLLPSVERRLSSLSNQSRKLRTLRFEADPESISLDDNEIEQYYLSKADRFRSPEQVKVDYIELSLAGVKQSIEVDPDDVRARYEDGLGAYTTPEIRQASHILIKVDDAEQSDAALEKITEIRNRIVAGEDFAELAREFSEDPGSAADGGDLGEIERGVMVQTFEAALFALQPDQLSEPVKTGFGWHLIKLRSISGGEVSPFEELQAQLEDEIKTELAESQIFDLVENLANLAYEQADSLLPAAEQLGLTVQTSDWFNRGNGGGIAAEAAVRQQAFSDEVLRQGLNSEAIELGSERVAFIRLNQHKAAETLPLEQVRERVVQELKLQKLQERNRSAGNSALQQLNDGMTLDQLAAEQGREINDLGFVTRDQAEIDRELHNRAFSMPKPEQGAVYDGVLLNNGEYAVIELSAVISNDAAPDQENLQRLEQNLAAAEYQAAVKMLKNQAEIVRTPLEEL